MKAPIEKKESFLVQYAWCESMKTLSHEQIGQVFMALFHYDKDGVIPDKLDTASMTAFNFMAPWVLKNRQKYDATCVKNKENGKLGGRGNKAEKEPNG